MTDRFSANGVSCLSNASCGWIVSATFAGRLRLALASVACLTGEIEAVSDCFDCTARAGDAATARAVTAPVTASSVRDMRGSFIEMDGPAGPGWVNQRLDIRYRERRDGLHRGA